MSVAVVTDSAANVPPHLVEQLGIRVLPMYLHFGDRTYSDGVDLPPGDFYAKLTEASTPVSTSASSPDDFRQIYAETLSRAESIVCVTVASFVSMNHSSAAVAAKEFGDRVDVVDSANASMGEGFIAIEAARAAQSGASLAEVAARARDVAARCQLVATIDTFEYLRRSGRVNSLLAYAGGALGIKPVFAFRGGKVEQLGRPRSRSRAIDRLLEEIRGSDSGDLHAAVCHAAAPDDAAALLDRVRRELSPVEALLGEFTPLMGAHTGPGLLAVASWR